MSARLLLLAGAFTACGDDADPYGEAPFVETYDEVVEIDCVGMMLDVGGFTTAYTYLPLLGEADEDVDAAVSDFAGSWDPPGVQRCMMTVIEPLTEGETLDRIGDFNFSAGEGVLWVVHDGQLYRSQSGDLKVDVYEPEVPGVAGRLARGTFDVYAKPEGSSGTAGGIRLIGDWDFCDYGTRACPYDIGDSLPKALTATSAGIRGTAPGSPSECRILASRSTGALRVDMQAGAWNGTNVFQLLNGSCGASGDFRLLNDNHFVFEAGGYAGPGTYGPFRSVDMGGRVLPYLDWLTPVTFLQTYSSSFDACIADGQYGGVEALTLQDRSACTWTVTESPGSFSLSCDEVSHWWYQSQAADAVGPFAIEMDCDFRWKD